MRAFSIGVSIAGILFLGFSLYTELINHDIIEATNWAVWGFGMIITGYLID